MHFPLATGCHFRAFDLLVSFSSSLLELSLELFASGRADFVLALTLVAPVASLKPTFFFIDDFSSSLLLESSLLLLSALVVCLVKLGLLETGTVPFFNFFLHLFFTLTVTVTATAGFFDRYRVLQ